MIKYEKGVNELLICNCSGNVSYQSANIRLSGLVFCLVWFGFFPTWLMYYAFFNDYKPQILAYFIHGIERVQYAYLLYFF